MGASRNTTSGSDPLIFVGNEESGDVDCCHAADNCPEATFSGLVEAGMEIHSHQAGDHAGRHQQDGHKREQLDRMVGALRSLGSEYVERADN